MKLPDGFSYSGVSCRIKQSGKKDLGLLVADNPCVAAGVYTKNMIRAACIDINRTITPTESCRAVVVNSGNANACTGQIGFENAKQTASLVASAIDCSDEQVLVLSTGIIGEQLPMQKIESGIVAATKQLGRTESDFLSLADAILTTDKYRKTKCSHIASDNQKVSLAGIAKGAGMIGPNMATMLSVLATDAKLSPEHAQRMLQVAVDLSFNRISVDGHTSTNDAVVLMASGRIDLSAADEVRFQSVLNETCLELAKMIPTDGEGASHLIGIFVDGANSDSDADQIARTIASSNLVKTAIHGCDPNWGRIVSAAGYSGIELNPETMSLIINGFSVFMNGVPIPFDEKQVSQSISSATEVSIHLNMGSGSGSSRHWTSDLTQDYVVLNSEYHT